MATTTAAERAVVGRGAPAGLVARDVGYEAGARRLLDGVSVEVRPGEVLALVGPNGAGKSTLLKALAGDLVPTAGGVTLDGRPLHDYPARELALRRAVLPQQTVLQFAFTAREVVEMGRSPHLDDARGRGRRGKGRTGERVADRVVAEAMARTETGPLAARVYPTLSGGEQGRVTLARVLAQEAPVLLLDEPTAALDLRHQQLVMEVARELAAGGAAVLAVLHDLNLAASHADRLAVLCGGRLRAVDEPWAVLTEGLLSEVFACPIAVCRHPVRGCPLVLPLAGGEPWLGSAGSGDASRPTTERGRR